jgi:hypothetical protein
MVSHSSHFHSHRGDVEALSAQRAGNQAGLSGRGLFHSPHLSEEKKGRWEGEQTLPRARLMAGGCSPTFTGTSASLPPTPSCSCSQRETEAGCALVAHIKPAAPKS